jgi:hypothetical protein
MKLRGERRTEKKRCKGITHEKEAVIVVTAWDSFRFFEREK